MSEQLDAWERREGAAYRLIPYFLLAASAVFAIAFMSEDWRLTLLLTAVTAGWLLLTQRHGPRIVHYLGLLVLIAVLVVHNPLFGFFSISGYLAADALPGRWMYAGVVWTAFWAGTSQVGGLPLPDSTPVSAWLAVVAVNMVVASPADGVRHRDRGAQPAAQGGAGRERRARARGRHPGGAPADGGRDPRHAGPGPDRDRRPARGARARAQPRRRLAPPPRHRRPARAREPDRGAALGPRRRPQALEDARLPDAIAEVARSWSAINGIEAEVVTTGTARPMHPDVEVTLLRAAQEALANVGRHAGASRVGLTLSYMEDVVTLDVRDDGVGFTPNGSTGFGLTAMRQRVERLDGRLVVESEPGGGTAICATVPVQEAA